MARAPRGCLDPLLRQLVIVRVPVIHCLVEELMRRHHVASAAAVPVAHSSCRPSPSHCPGLPKLGVAEIESVVSDRLRLR